MVGQYPHVCHLYHGESWLSKELLRDIFVGYNIVLYCTQLNLHGLK